MDRYDLISIGCGPAGEKAATQATYYGHRTAIVEKTARPGGAMVNTGTVPSKALRETALVCSALRRRPLPGVDFAVDRGVSIARFMARRHLIEQQEHDRIERSFDRHGIHVVHGRGRVVGPHTVEVTADDGSTRVLQGDHLLIATGSSPLQPAHVPFEHPHVVDADGVLELDRMPSSMVIVGAGVIGCEYASIFAEIGVAVTLINPQPDILPFLDAECREHLVCAMRDKDITFRHGAAVEAVTPQPDDRIEVTCKDGTVITTDVLLWAAGRCSNTTDLGLEEVGVELGPRGIIMVDDAYRTSVPSIWAAGDVIGFPALAATSMEQGRVAACHMFDIEFKTRIADTIPLGIYTIPGIGMVGLTEAEAVEKGHKTVTGRALYRYNVRGRMLGDDTGILKCVFDGETRRLLGAAIVGEDATELIHLAQAVLAHEGGIDYFINACFNYPTLVELYKYAAYSALQQIAEGDAATAA